MNRGQRHIAILLLVASAPLRAEPAASDRAVESFPQPALLDWGGQFRLNAAPTNATEAALKRAAEADRARARHDTADADAASRTRTTLGPDDPAKTRYTTRAITGDDAANNVKAKLDTGPLSVEASYGRYRAVPADPTREVNANDMRVTVGLPF